MVKTLDFETLTDEECELLKSLWSKENDYIKNKEMESKKNFNGELIQAIYDKKTTESEYLKLLKMISIKDSVFSTEKTVTDKTEFMLEDKQILTDASPYHLREDVEVIIASITRNIYSIVYAEKITDEIKRTAIAEAKRQGYVLSRNSPDFLKSDVEIIKRSLQIDENSEWYVNWKDLKQEELIDIEKFIIENNINYTIDLLSPVNFRRNVDICIMSAKNSPKSVTCFDWNYIDKNPEARERLIDALIEQKYVLQGNSPDVLKDNVRICLNSIKSDVSSAICFSDRIKNLLVSDLERSDLKEQVGEDEINRIYEIRHFLIENDYYSLSEILVFPASLLKDEIILEYCLKQLGKPKEFEDESTKLFYDRIKDFTETFLSSSLNVSDLRKAFHIVAQKDWEDYRRKNSDYYANVFNRICDSLEKNSNFFSAVVELKFLMKVDDVLDERKYALFNAFAEYHQLYHNSHAENKNELLQAKRDTISKSAALFIAKSKEDFISEEMGLLDKKYKQFFPLRTDSPIVRKKVVEVKQRNVLKELFNSQDADLMQKLVAIKNKYLEYTYNASVEGDKISQNIDLFILKIITDNVSSVDDILSESKPVRFDEYETYEKVSKLINRLNSYNISFDGPEVKKYKDFITFDGQKYVYTGARFDANELSQIMGYKDLKYVFGKIRSEIIQIAKTIDKIGDLTLEDVKSIIGECPFTDEYYKFDSSIFDKYPLHFLYDCLFYFEHNKEVILDDTSYRILQQLACSNGLIHISSLTELGRHSGGNLIVFNKMLECFSSFEVMDILTNLPKLMKILPADEININNLNTILDFKQLLKHADLIQISLLGKKVVEKIYNGNAYTTNTPSERMRVACDLVSAMVARSESTVPYIKGEYHNYRYSMYDSTDETLLISGIDTEACFSCCAYDNDFLHYCALDKNGFVIKLTDLEGNFIGRASGFRNGNGVYINQLRTIYDKKASAYSSEKEAIRKAFEQACSDIVETSQNNQSEENKIDFVVVTISYGFSASDSNIDHKTEYIIGDDPMDTESSDWKYFTSTTKNLEEADRKGYFTTDFGCYSLMCVKSAIGELTPEKIKKGDVPALYLRERKQVTIDEASDVIEGVVNKIRAIHAHQTGKGYSYLKIPKDCKIVSGDNWYIILGNQGIVDSCYLSNDVFAEKEFNVIMNQIMTNQQEFSDKHISIAKR